MKYDSDWPPFQDVLTYLRMGDTDLALELAEAILQDPEKYGPELGEKSLGFLEGIVAFENAIQKEAEAEENSDDLRFRMVTCGTCGEDSRVIQLQLRWTGGREQRACPVCLADVSLAS